MQEEAIRAGLEVAPLKVGWYNQVCLLNARLSSVCEENGRKGKRGPSVRTLGDTLDGVLFISGVPEATHASRLKG